MKRDEIINFGAGPAKLPDEVMQQAAKDLVNYQETGMGLGELSHRSATCANLLKGIEADLRKLIHVPDTHTILFMQGGGTTQFSATVYNMVSYWVKHDPSRTVGDYIVTGSWSAKAATEAKRLGIPVNIAANTKKDGIYGSLPESYNFTPNAAYVWYCDNETIDGVEFQSIPETDCPLICDMSSNFASRPIDVSKYAIIYAGAQKNVGLAGITILIVRNDILDRADAAEVRAAGLPVTPIMMDYRTIAENASLYNTLPIFTVHIVGLTFKHLLSIGMEKLSSINDEKSKLLYSTISSHSCLQVIPAPGCRSRMNVVFKMTNDKEKEFLAAAESNGMVQLKGHRSVGGLRASLYNAISLADVQKLSSFIDSFCQ